MTKSSHKIPQAIKIGWAIGELGVAFYIVVSMAFLMFFLTEALAISPAYAGLAIFVPRIWDAVTDPLMGIISDKTRSTMGRRRPYLLIGSILFGVSFWLTLSPPDNMSELGYVLYFSSMYILASTAFTLYDIPYSAMAAEMTVDYEERIRLISYKMMGARSGVIIGAFFSPIIYLSQDSLKQGFALLGTIGGFFIFISGIIAFVSTKNARRSESKGDKLSFKNLQFFSEMRQLVNNSAFTRLFMVFFLQNTAIGTSAAMLIYFLIFPLGAPQETIGTLFLYATLTALISTPVWTYISYRLGKKATYRKSLILTALIFCGVFFLNSDYFFLIYGIFILQGFGDAGNQLMPNSMVPDTVEYDYALTGQRREGLIYGAWAFCRKLGMAFGALIASLMMSSFGFISSASTQTEMAQLAIRISYTILPGLIWIAALFLLRSYQLDPRKLQNLSVDTVVVK